MSMMTMVALTTATAREPTSSPRSRTASVDMSDTIRWGPHWSSTWDMTVSLAMAVTSPTIRLRALLPMPEGSPGATAIDWAWRASSVPATTCRPASS